MWSLKNISTGTFYRFLNGKEYIVGRKNADILIENDTSISRKHAVLTVEMINGSDNSILVLKDVSKLGTQIGDHRISGGQEKEIRAGETISFGMIFSNHFEICYFPFIATASCLSNSEKKNLKFLINRLGGQLLKEWKSDCHFVVMNILSITSKVACALITQRDIVSPSYFENCVKILEKDITCELPQVQQYFPKISESQSLSCQVSFTPDIKRKEIFEGKTFFFLQNEQIENLRIVVELGKGSVKLLDFDRLEEGMKQEVGCKKNCLVVPNPDHSMVITNQLFSKLIFFMKKCQLRLISESEIGLAVLSGNICRYCNASYKEEEEEEEETDDEEAANKKKFQKHKNEVSTDSDMDDDFKNLTNYSTPQTKSCLSSTNNTCCKQENYVGKLIDSSPDLFNETKNDEVEMRIKEKKIQNFERKELSDINNQMKTNKKRIFVEPKYKENYPNIEKEKTIKKEKKVNLKKKQFISCDFIPNNSLTHEVKQLDLEDEGGGSVVEEVSLPIYNYSKNEKNSFQVGNFTEWKGKLYKNFKTFKKTNSFEKNKKKKLKMIKLIDLVENDPSDCYNEAINSAFRELNSSS